MKIQDYDLKLEVIDHQIDWAHLNRAHEAHKYVVGPNPPVVWWSI